MVSRIYVEKKPGFDVEAQQLAHELRSILGITSLEGLRLVNRYDVEGISQELFDQCVPTVFSEPQVDVASAELPQADGAQVFAVEFLPGQFDQRAASASECIQLISQGERPEVRSAKVYLLSGPLSDQDVQAIKHYVINPIEAREASLEQRDTLAMAQPQPEPVEVLEGFLDLDAAGLAQFIADRELAMDEADLAFCQQYFQSEGRCPTITEIKMIDTYWSDHCRHTTFGTEMTDVAIDDPRVQAAFDQYMDMRNELGRQAKPVCLMDMGTIGAKWLKSKGVLTGLDESEEINACTVKCKVDVDGEEQDWLYLFKNETHNHPTEIEPFGGAATCLGGAIRDPLVGPQLRVPGHARHRCSQPAGARVRDAARQAAAAQAGHHGRCRLFQPTAIRSAWQPARSTSCITPVTWPSAWRSAPLWPQRRPTTCAAKRPRPGDVVVLLGGRTGRDGIGGATGSSKEHNLESLEHCGAEVQKGNPPEERKIQRLFRRGEATRLIKRCNDFGAGGVSVAIGELADGLRIDLNKVPKKYEGLDGTELAISESPGAHGRAPSPPHDVDEFLRYAQRGEPRGHRGRRGHRRCACARACGTATPSSISAASSWQRNGAPKQQAVHVGQAGAYERTWEGETACSSA